MSRGRHLGLCTQICPRNTVGVTFSETCSPKLIPAFQGDIIYLRVYSQDIVVICSLSAVKDLFEKRGQTYSDRPQLPITEMYALWCSYFPITDMFTILDHQDGHELANIQERNE
jgi:hypothetical protein